MNQEIIEKNTTASLNTNQNSFGIIVYSVVVFIFIYLVIIRPNKKKINEYNKIVDSLKVGDEIIANGIYGKIKNIKDNIIELEISKNIIIKINKSIAYLSKK